MKKFFCIFKPTPRRKGPRHGGTTPRKSGGPEGWGPKVGPRRVGGPNFALFCPSPAPFSLFLSFSGGLLVEFWWCLNRRGGQMCTSGVLGLSCEAPTLCESTFQITVSSPDLPLLRARLSAREFCPSPLELAGPISEQWAIFGAWSRSPHHLYPTCGDVDSRPSSAGHVPDELRTQNKNLGMSSKIRANPDAMTSTERHVFKNLSLRQEAQGQGAVDGMHAEQQVPYPRIHTAAHQLILSGMAQTASIGLVELFKQSAPLFLRR